ncbi:unnamed protein product [Withania somnifera]
MKWLWRYNQEHASLWKEVVQAKHGFTNHWCTKVDRTPHGTGLWKGIRLLWDAFSLNTSLQAGNGEHILFWKDKWLGFNPLKDTYPRLFPLATNPDSTVAENREDNSWNLILRINLNDREIEDFLALLNCLQDSPEGYFTLSSKKNLIDQWPWKLIWRTKLPPNVISFSWITLKGATLTQDNLSRGNFSLQTDATCVIAAHVPPPSICKMLDQS